MSYMGRLWMATSVALVNCHSDQGGLKLKSALKSIDLGGKRFFFSGRSIPDVAELRSCSAVLNSDLRGFLQKKKQADVVESQLDQLEFFLEWLGRVDSHSLIGFLGVIMKELSCKGLI
ncbi:hypothetical protein ACP275_08G114800 [Erythranthe tilingii]